MNEEYKPITNLWKDSEGYRYFGTLKLSSKIKYDGDDFIPLWEWINQLQQENKILKENAEHNDKVVDKVNWENMLLKKENKQLKDNWNKLKEYFNERIEVCDNRLSTPFCNFEKVTKERLIFSQCLEKLEELEKGSDSNDSN